MHRDTGNKQASFNLRYLFCANFIEFADLYLFVHCAPIIGKLFVPPEYTSWMSNAGIWIAYGIPPLAAILFAYIGDDRGRRITMILSTGLMLFLTICLAALPSYEHIGIWATIAFCIIRVLQSFSIAGEGACAWIYTYEVTRPFSRTALTVPLISLGEMLSGVFSLVAFIGISYALPNYSEEAIIRMMFACLAAFFALILFNRKRLQESKSFLEARYSWGSSRLSVRKLYKGLAHLKRNRACLIAIMASYPLGFTISYVFVGDLLRQHLGFSDHDVMVHNSFVVLSELIFVAVVASLIYWLEKNKIANRKVPSALLPVISFGFSLFAYNQFSQGIFEEWMMGICQVGIIAPLNAAFIIGNFYKSFPVIGRFSAAAQAWAAARLIGLGLGVLWMQKLEAIGSLHYFLFMFMFLVIHIIGVIASKEPSPENFHE